MQLRTITKKPTLHVVVLYMGSTYPSLLRKMLQNYTKISSNTNIRVRIVQLWRKRITPISKLNIALTFLHPEFHYQLLSLEHWKATSSLFVDVVLKPDLDTTILTNFKTLANRMLLKHAMNNGYSSCSYHPVFFSYKIGLCCWKLFYWVVSLPWPGIVCLFGGRIKFSIKTPFNI